MSVCLIFFLLCTGTGLGGLLGVIGGGMVVRLLVGMVVRVPPPPPLCPLPLLVISGIPTLCTKTKTFGHQDSGTLGNRDNGEQMRAKRACPPQRLDFLREL